MLQQEDRNACLYRSRKVRHYPALPIEIRLKKWLKRIAKNTSTYPRPHCMEIRQKLATALGLPTRWVQLRVDGTLWHDSRLEPIADLNDLKDQ